MLFSRGQQLIEVILALAIFFAFLSGAILLSGRSLQTFRSAQELTDVELILTESLEAMQSIASTNWNAMTIGTFGLTSQGGAWQMQPSPDSINGTYLRTVTIDGTERDANCALVQTGQGTADPSTMHVTTTISWTEGGQNKSREVGAYFTDWKTPGACGETGQASNLDIDISLASIDATKKSLVGVVLTNNDSSSITLDTMTLTWTKPGEIGYIKIEGTNYWHSSNGTGSPQGEQPSGTELDLVDLVLEPEESYDIDVFRFDEKVDGATFTITATMIDGSSTTEVTTPPFVP
ncbi:MAG TPA: hypothetical protein DCY48_00575 [Candidatus Magasanikbacteria bacterium]|nr:MAG: hypothetical protein A3I74_02525 [Candidatus Magasanikbacteria bacterium RIFCSPLOWO2_02_FULL_47_16]OGH79619.1 MAG: hypothetical protein A3C10_00875 [Candidatus Magasanikbacteria bacterium RIFCSPHIGHO2_02_FULL_48_18]OGH82035.1 MAG: hypothetical protein A3G08_02385 [Candidatus Magasanikbacteria bacterium RIFCSPLOWO2_12_FULL_47_9b]HAZ28258.1 hypothetical protein [Candidatus Magasanikbacteria bacterium]